MCIGLSEAQTLHMNRITGACVVNDSDIQLKNCVLVLFVGSKGEGAEKEKEKNVELGTPNSILSTCINRVVVRN